MAIVPKVAKAPGIRAARAAAGEAHTLLLTGSGHVYSCGNGMLGALGIADERNSDVCTLRHIDRVWSLGIVKVACGDYHSVCLSCEGHCYSWGRGKHGQLGLGPSRIKLVSTPTLIDSMATEVVADVACGGEHTLILTHMYGMTYLHFKLC